MTTNSSVYFLLVDDLDENLLSLEALLQRDQLILLKAKSGPEALELLLKYDVALALLDVNMPIMDGFELAELMRGTERTRRVPIIFVTAGGNDAQRRFRGYETGAVDFINKPIETDILRSKAKVFFELYLQQQQIACQRDRLQVVAEENARLLAETREQAEILRESARHKDEFIATLAHELRNPLAPIRNGLEIMRRAPDNAATHDLHGVMERQLSHLVRLIDDLMDVSRVSQGKIDLRREPITLQAVLDSAVETSQPLIEQGHHNLQRDLPAEPLWLDGDLTRLAQVIANLLNNAAKYTPKSGKIILAAKVENDQVIISVTDNGMGIPANMLPHIFDLFIQVKSNIEQSQGGLGIGLALAKRLIEMHNGEIYAVSEGANQGSSFVIRLPLIQPPVRDTQNEENAAMPSAAQLKSVLVVDDNVAAAKTTGWMLELIGYEPTLSHNGLEAVQKAKEMQPDLILLDIGLPGMNGYEVCRELRKDPAFAKTLIIAQTGWGQDRDKREAKDAGFDQHMVKPVDLKQLTEIITGIEKQREQVG